MSQLEIKIGTMVMNYDLVAAVIGKAGADLIEDFMENAKCRTPNGHRYSDATRQFIAGMYVASATASRKAPQFKVL